MKPIDVIHVDGYNKLSDLVFRIANEGFTVCCVLSHEKAFELLKGLVTYGNEVKLGSIQLQNGEYANYNYDYNYYNQEYYVTLGSDMYLDIVPALNNVDKKHSKGYHYNEADVYLFDGDAHSSILKLYQKNICYELYIENNKSIKNVVNDILKFF